MKTIYIKHRAIVDDNFENLLKKAQEDYGMAYYTVVFPFSSNFIEAEAAILQFKDEEKYALISAIYIKDTYVLDIVASSPDLKALLELAKTHYKEMSKEGISG